VPTVSPQKTASAGDKWAQKGKNDPLKEKTTREEPENSLGTQKKPLQAGLWKKEKTGRSGRKIESECRLAQLQGVAAGHG